MSDSKTLWLTAAQIAAALAIGAGADRLAVTTFDTEAKPSHIRFLPDGQTAVAFKIKIGDCVAERELVYGVDGGVRLNGRQTDDSTAKTYAAVVEQAKTAVGNIDKQIADGVVEVRFLGDGQTALTLIRKEHGTNTYAELVVDADGGTPRLNGLPVSEDVTLKAVSDAARAAKVAAADVDTGTLTKPLEVQVQAPTTAIEPVLTDMRPPGAIKDGGGK